MLHFLILTLNHHLLISIDNKFDRLFDVEMDPLDEIRTLSFQSEVNTHNQDF